MKKIFLILFAVTALSSIRFLKIQCLRNPNGVHIMDKSMMKYFTLSILLSAVFSISAAFTQDFAEPKLPDTPAAMQFKKFLTAIESGDHEKYITEN